MPEYYVMRDGQQKGPYDEAQIRRWLADGSLSPADWCWRQGMQDWMPLGQVFPGAAGPAPPPMGAPGLAPSPMAAGAFVARQQQEPLFLYIPAVRLVALSIASMGLYEIYWIYRNWRYVKERDGLQITPFWRGIFGIFFCHSLLRRMYEDEEARAYWLPTFSPNGLATTWIILRLFANALDRAPQMWTSIVSGLIPSFLCLLPVQNYVNDVTRKRNPGCPYYGWSAGHVVCLVLGIILWILIILGTVVGD